jgi:proton glutamate symport protein
MKQTIDTLKSLSLSTQVFIGLILGTLVGAFIPDFAVELKPLSTIFLHMIKMLIAPLLFSTLVVGIAGTGGHKNLGRLGFKTILYFEIVTTLALIIGLVIANTLQPGVGFNIDLSSIDTSDMANIRQNAMAMSHHSFWDTVIHMFPESVIDSMAKGQILQLVVFSVFFALALAAAGDKGKPIFQACESLAEVMFKFVGYVMAFAPLGVFGAIAATIGKNGIDILFLYTKLIGTVYLALAVFVGVVLFSVCAAFKIPFVGLLKAIKEPILLAFSTASSESALPKAMETMERFGVPKNIVSFVMPTGYSFNLDGSTLYLSLATLFVAQMAGISLSIEQQLLIMLSLMLTSKGIAGVPRVALVVLAGTLLAFDLPAEGVAVILGIDHVLDMGRTTVNLVGNCIATAVIAKWENAFDDHKMNAYLSQLKPSVDPRMSSPPLTAPTYSGLQPSVFDSVGNRESQQPVGALSSD